MLLGNYVSVNSSWAMVSKTQQAVHSYNISHECQKGSGA